MDDSTPSLSPSPAHNICELIEFNFFQIILNLENNFHIIISSCNYFL